MKKFTFSLQPLYDVKKTLEFHQKVLMKTIEGRLAVLNREMEETKNTMDKTNRMYSMDMRRGVQASKLTQYSQYLKALSGTLSVQKERIAVAEEEKQKCIEVQVETRKEIKALDKLRDIEFQEYLAKQKIEEDKAMGDILSYKIAAS